MRDVVATNGPNLAIVGERWLSVTFFSAEVSTSGIPSALRDALRAAGLPGAIGGKGQ